MTEPGATVRLSEGSLLVTGPDSQEGDGAPDQKRRKLASVELHRLELVVLVGRAHVTADALAACLDEGIALAWLSCGGRLRGRLVPEQARAADLRLRQFAASQGEECLARGRAVVAAKLANAVQVLQAIQSNESGNAVLNTALAALRGLAGEPERCASAEALRGLEGTAARHYFAGYGAAFKSEIQFPGRERRPPPDPANALLSFGYVLLSNLLSGIIEARGLDPALGFYHETRAGRASLALDLLEELRHPVVDRAILRICNLRILRPEHFEPDQERPGGVRLTREGLKRFFEEWERHLQRPLPERGTSERLDVHSLLRRQVERLVADLRGKEPYRPYLYEA